MKKCKYCKSEIDSKAKICPNCHRKQSTPGCLIAIVIFIVIIIIAALSGGENDSNSSKNETITKNTTKVVTTTKDPAVEKQEFISQCQSFAYDDIARNPDNYKDNKAVFTGEVIQVSEGWNNSIVMRVNVTKGDYDIWDDTIYVTYTYADGESKILEDDIITMYGTLKGSETYTTVLGASVTIPKFEAEYININQ